MAKSKASELAVGGSVNAGTLFTQPDYAALSDFKGENAMASIDISPNLNTNSGNVVILDSQFNSVINSSNGHAIFGTNGDDTLLGNKGKDILIGGDGNDQLIGYEGNDILIGGNGDDILVAGDPAGYSWTKGNDIMTGGAGNDTFMFSSYSGKDVTTITDFVSGQDHLAFAFNIPAYFYGQVADINLPNTNNYYVIFDTSTGNLYHDPDASGVNDPLLIATLVGVNSLVLSDFL